MNEAELKYAVSEYLQYKMNAGELYFDRLNSGSLLAKRGEKVYKVELCREGTADFFVLTMFQSGSRIPRIIFLELKSEKGKTSPAQNDFKVLVESQGAQYFVIRSIEELEETLK